MSVRTGRPDVHGRPVYRAPVLLRLPEIVFLVVAAALVGVVIGFGFGVGVGNCERIHLTAADRAAIEAQYEVLPDVLDTQRAVADGLRRVGR